MLIAALALALAATLSELLAPPLTGHRYALHHFAYDAWPNMDLWRPSKDLPYELIPNLIGSRTSLGNGLFTNSLGMRDREHSLAAKALGTTRIAILSDSIGMYGRWPDMLGEMLERAAPGRYDVWNWSIGGFGLAEYARVFTNRALLFQPDIVLIGFELNDLKPTRVILKASDGRLLSYRPFNLPGGLYLDNFLYAHSYLYRMSMSFLERWKGVSGGSFQDRLRFGAPALEKILSAARSRSIRVVAAIFPRLKSPERYTDDELTGWGSISELLRRDGVPFLDLSAVFAKTGRERYRWKLGDAIHFNDAGSRIIARALLDFLRRQGLVTGRRFQPTAAP